MEGRGEFVCADCGYGVYRTRPPELCPMCLGTDWRAGSWLMRHVEGRPVTAHASAANDVADPTVVKRHMNGMIRRSLDPADAERVAFLCECRDATCYSRIWLTSDEYDRATSETSDAALARGHGGAAAALSADP